MSVEDLVSAFDMKFYAMKEESGTRNCEGEGEFVIPFLTHVVLQSEPLKKQGGGGIFLLCCLVTYCSAIAF